MDSHDAERLRSPDRAAIQNHQHLHLPLCPLVGLLQQQRQSNHLRFLQRELPQWISGGVQVQPVRGGRTAAEDILAQAAGKLRAPGQQRTDHSGAYFSQQPGKDVIQAIQPRD